MCIFFYSDHSSECLLQLTFRIHSAFKALWQFVGEMSLELLANKSLCARIYFYN